MLSFLVDRSRARGKTELRGWFLPTAKNAPAADLFRHHGFELRSSTATGSCWSLRLADAAVTCPEWIALTAEPVLQARSAMEGAHAL